MNLYATIVLYLCHLKLCKICGWCADMCPFDGLMTHTSDAVAISVTQAGVWDRGPPVLVALESTTLKLERAHTHTHNLR